jgi:hypothetical protein
MRYRLLAGCVALLLSLVVVAAARDHTAVFGDWVNVKMFVGPERDHSVEMKIRPLYMDGDLEEFTTGQAHNIGESQFVVRRVYRLSNRMVLNGAPAPFLWQRGGWILVDRTRGRVVPLNLPDFDPFYSVASWSQDWVAYCGMSGEGTQVYGVVAKLDQRDPIVRKPLREASGSPKPDGECEAPRWDQQPGHVTFLPVGGPAVTVSIGAAPVSSN